MPRKSRFVLATLILGAAPVLASAAPELAGRCDRQCLVGFAEQYAVALVNHAPSTLPAAPSVKFTENLVPLKFGEQGLWRTVTGRRDFNIYAADTDSGNSVWIGIVLENDTAVMTTARLKIVNRRVTEVETLVGRSPLTGA